MWFAAHCSPAVAPSLPFRKTTIALVWGARSQDQACSRRSANSFDRHSIWDTNLVGHSSLAEELFCNSDESFAGVPTTEYGRWLLFHGIINWNILHCIHLGHSDWPTVIIGVIIEVPFPFRFVSTAGKAPICNIKKEGQAISHRFWTGTILNSALWSNHVLYHGARLKPKEDNGIAISSTNI